MADTKLARHTKASALLQICSYIEQLTRIQGRQPEWMHVALGGSARTVDRHRVTDYMAYYRQARRLFEANVAANEPAYPPTATYPEPVEHCDVCRWSELCTARRRADDDLSLVAGITSRQRGALRAREVPTRRGLAGLELPLAPPLEGVGAESLERVHRQARLQVEGEDAGRVLHELVEPSRLTDGTLEPNRGLLSLPEPRPGDLFFDIEGDPYAFDDGIEYLFGVLEPRLDAAGNATFHAFWAREADGRVTLDAEKRAFEQLMDFFMDRSTRPGDPHLPLRPVRAHRPRPAHGRHGTRETRSTSSSGQRPRRPLPGRPPGHQASVESYSISSSPSTASRGDRDEGRRLSIAAFEAWLQLGGEGGLTTGPPRSALQP